jgi:hypothetical protein
VKVCEHGQIPMTLPKCQKLIQYIITCETSKQTVAHKTLITVIHFYLGDATLFTHA